LGIFCRRITKETCAPLAAVPPEDLSRKLMAPIMNDPDVLINFCMGMPERGELQLIQRSNDGGETWEPVGNRFVFDGDIGNYEGHDGTPQAWEFKRIWHLEPSLTDPDTIYAGAEDASLFGSTDGGQINRGLKSQYIPDLTPRSATAFIASRCTARDRACCLCRSTGTSCIATTPEIRSRK
jgi:hypothetical protein